MDSIIDQVDVSSNSSAAKILVVGVGGGGGNAVQNMIDLGITNVKFICANTDVQALNNNTAPVRIQLGEKLTKGLGAGSDPEVGREAANESLDTIQQALEGADMVFVTAGMGGGTGTGAAPVVAEIAKKSNALTVAVVTSPFTFEGKKRAEFAKQGIEELSKHVDCLITVPNDRIMKIAPKKTPFKELLLRANDVLYYGVKGISDVINADGLINLDFADVRTCMLSSGLALMGMGSGHGESRAEEAINDAIKSPLLEDISLSSAKNVLYNVSAPSDITLEEVELIGEKVRSEVSENALVMTGVVFDPSLDDEIRVTVIATGIEPAAVQKISPETLRRTGSRQTFTGGQPSSVPAGPRPVSSAPQPLSRPLQELPPDQRPQMPQQMPQPQPANVIHGMESLRMQWNETGLQIDSSRSPEVGVDAYEVPAFIRKSIN